MALNDRLKSKGEMLCGKSEDEKFSSKQDWGKPVECAWVYILSRGLYLCTPDLQISYAIVHQGSMCSIA